MVDSFAAPEFWRREIVVEGRGLPSSPIDGRMRRFCFEGGRISSKSTGTPRETRKRAVGSGSSWGVAWWGRDELLPEGEGAIG